MSIIGVFIIADFKVVNGNLEYELADLIEETNRISKLNEKDSVKSYMMENIFRDFRYLNDPSTRTVIDQIFFTFGYQDLIDLAVEVSKSSDYDYSYNREMIINKYNIIMNDNRYRYNKETKKEVIKNIIKHLSIYNINKIMKLNLVFIYEYYFVKGVVNVLADEKEYSTMLKLMGANIKMFDKRDVRKFTKLAYMNYKYSEYNFYDKNRELEHLSYIYVEVLCTKDQKTGVCEYFDSYENVVHDFLDMNIVLDDKIKGHSYYRYAYLLEKYPVRYRMWELFEKDDKKRRIYINKIIESYMSVYGADLQLALKFLIHDISSVYSKTGYVMDQMKRSIYTKLRKEEIVYSKDIKETRKKINGDIAYLKNMEETEKKYEFGGEGFLESGEDYIKRLTKE